MSDVSIPSAEESSSVIVELGDEEDPNIGRVLNGRYRLESRLGVGGYGIVYAGTYLENDSKIAVKMLRSTEHHNQEVRARFRREGEALSNLKSKHVVRTYEFNYDDDGSMFIVMELLTGRTMKDELRKLGTIPWERGLTILAQICDALTEAHAIGYVHRDLKPENIYLMDQEDGSDLVKVLDFGIAKKLQLFGHQEGAETQLTAMGQTVGTMRYMSPEQLLGQPVDSRSDIYSLGVLTYRMLTGRVPFPKAKNMARLIAAQLQQTPKPLSKVARNPDIPEHVDELVAMMLEKTAPTRLPNTEVLRIACLEIAENGEWSSVDRYRRKSAKDAEEEEDATAKGEAVAPDEVAELLTPEAQRDLALITGHNLPRPKVAIDMGAGEPDITEKTATAEPVPFEPDLGPEANALLVGKKSPIPMILLMVLVFGAGVAVAALFL